VEIPSSGGELEERSRAVVSRFIRPVQVAIAHRT